MSNLRLKLSPPWITYVNEVNALFENDDDVKVIYENSKLTLKIFVEKVRKAAAISQLMPTEKEFGNVKLKISVIPANGGVMKPIRETNEVFEAAFEDNPALSFVETVPSSLWSFNCTYVVFKNKVVQFFNDNLKDIHGNMSTLYQDIAEDVFTEMYGVSYCTDIEEKIGKSKEDWLK